MLFLKPINASHFFLSIEINKEFNPIEPIDNNKFIEYIVNLPKGIEIYVLYNNDQVIGCGTLIIEQKMIHNFAYVGHIEDVFIRPQFRDKSYGKELIYRITHIGEKRGCYKVILDCKKELVEFYEKCGYENKNVQMSKYF